MTKKYVRVGFTSAQKTELWERWRSGEQMKSLDESSGSVRRVYSVTLDRRVALRRLCASARG